MSIQRDLHEANRASWNAATRAHNTHKDGQAAFLRGGGSTLFPEETALLGDVRGRRVLHLACNAGPDTLSIARLGAMVTGVDISDEAIAYARRLAADTGLAGDFVRADVYDFLAEAATSERRWDVVFASYGALCWMSDVAAWMRGAARVLVPGGRVVVMEFHPVAGMFDEEWRRAWPYFCGGTPIAAPTGVGDYVALSEGGLVPWATPAAAAAGAFTNPHPAHCFEWSIGEILGGALAAGLRLEHFAEYPFSNGCKLFSRMELRDGRRFYPPADVPALPLMYSLVAARP